MKFRPDKDYTDRVEEFLRGYYHTQYLADSGRYIKYRLTELFIINQDLFDNSNIVKSGYEKTDILRLYNRLITKLICKFRCSAVNEKFFYATKVRKFRSSGFDTTLNGAIGSLTLTKKRESRLQTGKFIKNEILGLEQMLKEFKDKHNETACDLGYKSYPDMLESINYISGADIRIQYNKLIKATDYIYKDLIYWHLKKYLDIRPEDASQADILYLFNSFNFHEHFRGRMSLLNSLSSLEEMGISTLKGIFIDTEPRIYKSIISATYPIVVPGRIRISVYRYNSIEDFISLYGELGISVFLNNLEIEESFENKRLQNPICLELLKTLFGRLVQKEKWLERYLGIKTDVNFRNFLALRQLSYIRYLCSKLQLTNAAYHSGNFREILNEIGSTYSSVMHTKANPGIILHDMLLSGGDTTIEFSALLLAAILEKSLRDKYDEQWWRDPGSGDEIISYSKAPNSLNPYCIAGLGEKQEMTCDPVIKVFEDIFR